MRRLLPLVLVALASLLLINPASAADDDDEEVNPPVEEPSTETVLVGTNLVLTAAAPGTLQLTENPGRPFNGPRVYCGWLELSINSTNVDIYQVVRAVVGETYIFTCWYTAPWVDPLAGYPIVTVYQSPEDPPPGNVITAATAALFAINNINFETPTVDINPVGRQIVGVPSWLAVTSNLGYPAISAEAGPVWATVRPEFRDVTWTLGNGDELVCTTDATTSWNPGAGPEQSSDCTYTYEASAVDGAFAASATVNWTIWQITNETGGNWTEWGTVSLTTTLDIPVAQLQAAIH